MKKITLAQVKPYEAPGHFKMVALRLSGKDETGAQNCGCTREERTGENGNEDKTCA